MARAENGGIENPGPVSDDGPVIRPRETTGRHRVGGGFRLVPRTVTTIVAGVLALGLTLGMLTISPPYAIQRPGPTLDTLGDVDDEPLITVEGAESYPASGELRLTTVSVVGGPGFPAQIGDVLRGWLTAGQTVLPRETLFDESDTQEEVSERSAAAMTSSQTNASVAALEHLGYEIPAELVVVLATEDGGSAGLVEPDDVIVGIASSQVGEVEPENFADLSAALAATPAGETVGLTVLREGEEVELQVVTADDGSGGSLLGVVISPVLELPVEIEFAIENVGGPSAGLMLALGILDLLTPGELTGEQHIAGTGTIALDGAVGSIGGIRQKMVGAARDGADWFLAPLANCAETIGHVPEGLRVVPVTAFDDAVEVVEAIAAGESADLPTCEGG